MRCKDRGTSKTALFANFAVVALVSAGCGGTPEAQKPTPTPTVIESFSASATSVAEGESVDLTWRALNADTIVVEARPGGVLAGPTPELEGTANSGPLQETTVFKLTATQGADSRTRELTVTVDVARAPQIRTFSASPASLQAGEMTTLAWSTADAQRVDLLTSTGREILRDGDVAGVATDTPDTTTTYILTAHGASRQMVKQEVTVNVSASGRPASVTTFAAAATQIEAGASTELRWQVTGEAPVQVRILDSAGIAVSSGTEMLGETVVSPAQTETYRLEALNAHGSDTATVTITVTPRVSSFVAIPSAIAAGQSSTLSWEVVNADRVQISDGVRTVLDSTELTGSFSASPAEDTTYLLTASRGGATAEATVIVRVLAANPTIASFTAIPPQIGAGATSTLSWSVSDAVRVEVRDGSTTLIDTTDLDGTLSVSPTLDTTYTLTAFGLSANAAATTTVSIVPAPTVASFAASPTSVSAGGPATLSWQVTGATRVDISDGRTVVGTSPSLIGTLSVSPSVTTTYTLTAIGQFTNTRATVTVTIVPDPVVTSFRATPPSISAGGSTTLSWSVTHATRIEVSDGVTTFVNSANLSGAQTVNPSATTTYTLTAIGPLATATATATIRVTVPPAVVAFTAQPATIAPGGTTTLSWQVTDATRIEVSDGAMVVASSTNLVGSASVSPSATTTYTLTAFGTLNNATQAVTVTIAPVPVVASFTANPNPAEFLAGSTTLNWSVTGASTVRLISGATVLHTTSTGSGSLSVSLAGPSTDFLLEAESVAGVATAAVSAEWASTPYVGPLPGQGTSWPFNLQVGGTVAIEVTLSQESYVWAETFGDNTLTHCNGIDTYVAVLDQSATTVLGDDFDGGRYAPCSSVGLRLAAGTYYVIVQEDGNNAAISNALLAIWSEPVDVCGNFITEVGEACDDGNITSGDGCDASCQWEVAGTFNAPGGPTTLTGSVPASGSQRYLVDVALESRLSVRTYSSAATGACNGIDTVITLTDAIGQLLGTNDDFAGTVCSGFDPLVDGFATLASGTYFLEVAGYGNAAVPSYDIVFEAIRASGCGNGVRDGTEVCDGADLGAATCASVAGLASGTLACATNCQGYDLSDCYSCGNGSIEGPEVCDGASLGGATCSTETNHSQGAVVCATDCLSVDSSACHTCGNGSVEGSEVCDGANLGGQTCFTQTGKTQGTITCDATCQGFATSACYQCGDGVAEGPEVCDGNDFRGLSCATEASHASGRLTCGAACTMVSANQCYTCGNGTIEGPEVCDGPNFNGLTCQSEAGHQSGSLSCIAQCLLVDTAGCNTCGNAVVEGSEQCDGPSLDGADCASVGRPGGVLQCDASCGFDLSQCSACGDGLCEPLLGETPANCPSECSWGEPWPGGGAMFASRGDGVLRAWSQLLSNYPSWQVFGFGLGTSTLNNCDAASDDCRVQFPAEVNGVAKVQGALGGSCFLSDAGLVYCTGDNTFGLLGNGTTTDSSTPLRVPGLTGIVDLGADRYNVCALRSDGAVYCWGHNGSGQVGDGTRTTRTSPVQVAGIFDAVEIELSSYGSCVRRSTGSVVCWGGTNGLSPTTVPGLTDAVDIDVARFHMCAVRQTGAVVCWGDNNYGQLGIGTVGGSSLAPMTVLGVSNSLEIATSNRTSCARLASGTAVCWGENLNSSLGDPTRSSQSPTAAIVPNVAGARAIRAGGGRTCVQRGPSDWLCWGDLLGQNATAFDP